MAAFPAPDRFSGELIVRIFLIAALAVGLFSAQAHACGLDEMVRGHCPLIESEASDPDGFRGAIELARSWREWPQRDTLLTDNGRWQLNVCAYQTKVTGEATHAVIAEFTDDKARRKWESRLKTVRRHATKWQEITQDGINGVRQSRIVFNFYKADGAFRRCEEHPTDHVRIAFTERNETTKSGPLRAALTGTLSMRPDIVDTPSMWLPLSQTGGFKRTVQHEFGHALGFVHETKHPTWASKCYDHFSATKFAMKALGAKDEASAQMIVDSQLKGTLKEPQVEMTKEFDDRSVMAYRVGARFFDNDKGAECALTKGAKISDDDEYTFMLVYGMDAPN